jgi:hypothetical protein
MCGFRVLVLIFVSICFAGCGLTVPDIKEPWDADKPPDAIAPNGVSGTAQIEFEIKKRIYCDLKEAVMAANKIPVEAGSAGKLMVKQPGLIPASWGAQISLSLQVDETSGLNPGVAWNEVLPNATHVFGPGTAGTVTSPQSFNLGLGGTLSSTATRTDKFDPYYSIQNLLKDDTKASVCWGGKPYTENDPLWKGWTPASSSPFIVESDLRIKEWLVGAMMVDNALPSDPVPAQLGGQPDAAGLKNGRQSATGSKNVTPKKDTNVTPTKDTVSLEIKFIIVTSGNVTPTWKLVRISANSGSTPFFNTGRTRTHDLIITIGDPSVITANSHLASQIGNSVGNANKAAMSAGGTN